MTYTLLFIVGAILGSFLNVCITRLPLAKSIILPPSSCPNCGQRIKPYHNIPIVSYLYLKGKCCYCGWKIPVRYLFVEIISGLLLVLLYHAFSFQPIFFFYTILSFLLIVITFIDIEQKLILNKMTIPGIIIGISFSLITDILSISQLIYGIFSGTGFLILVAIVGRLIFRKESMGGGDIKLVAMIGSFIGFDGVVTTLFVGFLTAAVVGLFLAYKFKIEYIPFGPFISAGALIFVFTNDQIFQFFSFR